MTGILKENIYSSFKKGEQYGKSGEKVKIIIDGDVLIVENIKGARYPVRRDKVITN